MLRKIFASAIAAAILMPTSTDAITRARVPQLKFKPTFYDILKRRKVVKLPRIYETVTKPTPAGSSQLSQLDPVVDPSSEPIITPGIMGETPTLSIQTPYGGMMYPMPELEPNRYQDQWLIR